MNSIIQSLKEAATYLEKNSKSRAFISSIENAIEQVLLCFKNNGKIIIFGNGGSACDANHFAEELVGRYHLNRPALPALSLNDGAMLTCIANDYGFSDIFLRGVQAFAQKNDLIIGISTSGNSTNVKKALDYAKKNHIPTLALLGKTGGEMKDHYDNEILVLGDKTERIQEIHIKVLHIITDEVEKKLFS